MMTIAKNIRRLQSDIAKITQRVGRTPDSVRLVAVSKRFPAEAIAQACAAGQFLFGENYIQEAQRKYEVLHDPIRFHFIGHLQSNKAKIAARIFTMVETVDRIKLATALHRELDRLDRDLEVLVQVNIAGDDAKSGVSPENTEALLVQLGELPRLQVCGLMTMPPFTEDPEESRPHFRGLRQLAEDLARKKLFHDNKSIELSMGMTNDYPVAIEEGATLVRIGTAIFGQRS